MILDHLKLFVVDEADKENFQYGAYTKFGDKEKELAIGRKVFRIIHKEFEECLKEVLRFYKIYEYDLMTEEGKEYLIERGSL